MVLLLMLTLLKIKRYCQSRLYHTDFEMWKRLPDNREKFLEALNHLDYQTSFKRRNSTGSDIEMTTTDAGNQERPVVVN